MSENSKNKNSKIKYVTANLVATYDMSPADARSVSAIDYLCTYEYEYDGKKYNYRMHQRDNFSPIPETIELCFTKDPGKAHRVNASAKNDDVKSSSGINIWAVVWIFVIVAVLIIVCAIYHMMKVISQIELEMSSIPILAILVCLFILGNRSVYKTRKRQKNRDAMIEDALLNNRTVMAYLTKTRQRWWTNEESQDLKVRYKEFPYTAEYTYEYNGKKYNKSFEFSSTPPGSIRVFFDKNPKDVFYFTGNK